MTPEQLETIAKQAEYLIRCKGRYNTEQAMIKLAALFGVEIAATVPSPDQNVERVREMLLQRSQVGLAKYGTTTERDDLSPLEWLQHLQEELADALVYIEAFKKTAAQVQFDKLLDAFAGGVEQGKAEATNLQEDKRNAERRLQFLVDETALVETAHGPLYRVYWFNSRTWQSEWFPSPAAAIDAAIAARKG